MVQVKKPLPYMVSCKPQVHTNHTYTTWSTRVITHKRICTPKHHTNMCPCFLFPSCYTVNNCYQSLYTDTMKLSYFTPLRVLNEAYMQLRWHGPGMEWGLTCLVCIRTTSCANTLSLVTRGATRALTTRGRSSSSTILQSNSLYSNSFLRLYNDGQSQLTHQHL